MNHLAFIPRALSDLTSCVVRVTVAMLTIVSVIIISTAGLETARSSARASSSRTKSESKRFLSVKGTLATGLWRSAGHLEDGRISHTQTLLQDGRVVVVGGSGAGDFSTEVYNPLTNQWSPSDRPADFRFWHTATLLANGKVLVAGGANGGGSVFRVELFNPASGTWGDVASLPTAFDHHTATLLNNGKVLLAGGDGPGSNSSNATALYDPAANTWTTGQLPSGRSRHTATLLRDGKVLLAGGVASSGALSTAVLYNPETNTWSAAGSMSVERIGHTAALLQNGKVLVVGGGFGLLNFGATDTAELYDPATNLWSNVGKMNATRSSHTATLLTNGKVLVAGGTGTGGASSELFDPATNSWTYSGGLNDDRVLHTATLLTNGSVLIAGGLGQDSALLAAELYDPAAGDTGGQKLVFASSRNGGNHDIYVMNPDGSNQTRLTTNPAYDDQPKWSPDGSKIAFISNRDLNFEIYTMNADGTGQTRLTNNPAGDGFPAWSPDGKKIAFVSGDLRNPQSFEIYVMNSDGSSRTRLTNDSLIDCLPSWSPDGQKILFMSGPGSLFDINSFELFTMNTDGTNRVRLTNNTVADGQASFSPDGTKILFASGDAMNPNGIEIFLMNADGSNRTRLTNNSVTDGFPAWSADGSKIVFASGNIGDERTVEISTMNTDGSNQTRVTNNSSLDWFVDWQPIPASQIRFGSSVYTVGEGVGSALVTIVRSGDTSAAATIEYATSDAAGANSCALLNGIASSHCDYVAMAGTLSFAANETSKSVAIPIIDDSYAEGPESFSIILGNPVNSALGSPAATRVNLIDNETVNGTNVIDTAGIFVRQHYLDFLHREPDNSGLSFWTNEITSCGADTGCTEVKRVNVSASFFLSIEFQGTGYLVERIYKAAYGDATGTSLLGGTHQLVVPIIRLTEFLPDVQEIGQGVVVLQPGWEQVLESNKKAFTAEFVQRSRFISAYPASMTAAEFVDKLNTNAGNPLSQSERNQLVIDLSTNAKTRAEVVRSVAEHPNLINAEFNRAFVLMQYLGYLRRNPNDAPDSDHTGYDFWLTKLNQVNGNYINAEMVKAFLASSEYRQRFGP